MIPDLKPWLTKVGIDPAKITLWSKKDISLDPEDPEVVAAKALRKKETQDALSSMSKVLTGPLTVIGDFYFPTELIGGTCPHIPGEEEEIVWNAAAEACDTERVHVVWHVMGSRIYYLAVRSTDLASHPNTWCPFASLLPGGKGVLAPPVCYTYYGEEMATVMTITSDSLQIYRGTPLVVRAKAERIAREMNNAPIIELIPEKIADFVPVQWYSMSLFVDRARRILAALAVLTALGLTVLAFIVWLFAGMAMVATKTDLAETHKRTQEKTLQLLRTVEELHASPMRKQLADFARINDGLLALNGFLVTYTLEGGKLRWRAIVPANVTADHINELGGKSIEPLPDGGVAIGNPAEVEFEIANPGRK
jgi:hypothetical protein